MRDNVNMNELERLAKIGSQDDMGDVGTDSIVTSIVASILYCTSVVVSAITAISAVSIGASALFSCVNNPAQCQ